MLSDLDWKSKARDAKLAAHWRIFFCVLLGAVASTAIWFERTPHAFWFLVLWCGLATGVFVGLLPGIAWQLRSRLRWGTTSAWMLIASFLAWGAMALAAISFLAPRLSIDENPRSMFRALSGDAINAIEFDGDGQRIRRSTPAEKSSFATLAKNSELLYPSHEGSSKQFSLRLELRDSSPLVCSGRLPERHPLDFSLRCSKGIGEILVPNGREWLKSATAASG